MRILIHSRQTHTNRTHFSKIRALFFYFQKRETSSPLLPPPPRPTSCAPDIFHFISTQHLLKLLVSFICNWKLHILFMVYILSLNILLTIFSFFSILNYCEGREYVRRQLKCISTLISPNPFLRLLVRVDSFNFYFGARQKDARKKW